MVVSPAPIASFQRKRKSSKRNPKRRQGDKQVCLEDPPSDLKPFPLKDLPLDLQVEFLTRLPLNSLMRFKSASKHWYSFIRSRDFSNRYLMIASPKAPPRLYISILSHPGCNSMEVCHCNCKPKLLSLSSSSSHDDTFKHDDKDTIRGMGGRDMVVLRGLILYVVCTRAYIYNPTTRQSVTLPAVDSKIFAQLDRTMKFFYFFGHDPVLDQYKVVCTVVRYKKHLNRIRSEHWVLVLEAGGSWKRIEFDQKRHLPTRAGGVCLNGVIYYLASTKVSRDVIFSFDVKSEKYNMIKVPDAVSEYESLGIIEYGGKPAIFEHTYLGEEGLANLWVLEDGGNWSTKSLVVQPSQLHLVEYASLKVQGTTQNGEVILAPTRFESLNYLLYYDLENNDLRKVEITGLPYESCYVFVKLMDQGESIMHLEI